MRSLLAGFDVSPRRMGWALCDLVSGEPVACGCEAIELPKNGWDRKQIIWGLNNAGLFDWMDSWKVRAVYLEHPISRFNLVSYHAGFAVGMTAAEVQRRWPHAPVEYLKPSEWRLLAGLKGNASKADVYVEALRVLKVTDVGDMPNQDAADALLIAVAGQRRNGENWSRAVERGEAA